MIVAITPATPEPSVVSIAYTVCELHEATSPAICIRSVWSHWSTVVEPTSLPLTYTVAASSALQNEGGRPSARRAAHAALLKVRLHGLAPDVDLAVARAVAVEAVVVVVAARGAAAPDLVGRREAGGPDPVRVQRDVRAVPSPGRVRHYVLIFI